MSTGRSLPVKAVQLAAVVAALALTAAAAPALAIAALPGVILLVLLIVGRPPGERLILRLLTRGRRARRRPVLRIARPHSTLLVPARSPLVAFALAMRPPPALAVSH